MIIFSRDLTNETVIPFVKGDTGVITFAGIQELEGSGPEGSGPQMLSPLNIYDLIDLLSNDNNIIN